MKRLTRATVTVAAGASFPADGSFVPVYLQPERWTNSDGADPERFHFAPGDDFV